jgi:hypothetical protein
MRAIFESDEDFLSVKLPVVAGVLDARGAGRLVVGGTHDGARIGFAVRLEPLVPGAIGPATETMFVPIRDEQGVVARFRPATREEMAANPDQVKKRWRQNPAARPVVEGVVLESIGEPSDRFLSALVRAYLDRPVSERTRMNAETRFVALCQSVIAHDEPMCTKLFAQNDDADHANVELFLNLDGARTILELAEKDPSYRVAVLLALGASL